MAWTASEVSPLLPLEEAGGIAWEPCRIRLSISAEVGEGGWKEEKGKNQREGEEKLPRLGPAIMRDVLLLSRHQEE